MAYIDLVLCRFKNGIALKKAPKFSSLKANEDVYVECCPHDFGKSIEMKYDEPKLATVVDTISINEESEECKFICHCFGTEPEKLQKVLSVIKVHELKYQEEEDG